VFAVLKYNFFFNCYFSREAASAEAVLQLCPAHDIHTHTVITNVIRVLDIWLLSAYYQQYHQLIMSE